MTTRKRSSRATPVRPHRPPPEGAFDQSLKFLLHRSPEAFISFGMQKQTITVIRPVEAALPAQGRDMDGGYLVRSDGQELVVHLEFHRRHQGLDELAVDIAEAQVRLFRREKLPVLSLLWDLYGDAGEPLLSERELVLGVPIAQRSSRCVYQRVNLRGLSWRQLLYSPTPALWSLLPLTHGGATTQAVLAARDALSAQPQLSLVDQAEQLAVLLFLAEAEGVALSVLRAYIKEEALMQSTFYNSILEKGFDRGFAKGGARKEAETIVKLLSRRLGYLDNALRTRILEEPDPAVIQPWYDEALGVLDEHAAQQLITRIRRAPPLTSSDDSTTED